VTGSSGLIDPEVDKHFDRQGRPVIGVDKNRRQALMKPAGDTTWNRGGLKRTRRNKKVC
jgi:hypothetical protein